MSSTKQTPLLSKIIFIIILMGFFQKVKAQSDSISFNTKVKLINISLPSIEKEGRKADISKTTNSTLKASLQGAAEGYIELRMNSDPENLWQRMNIDTIVVDIDLEASPLFDAGDTTNYLITNKVGSIEFRGEATSYDGSKFQINYYRTLETDANEGIMKYSQKENKIISINFPIDLSGKEARVYNIEYLRDTIKVSLDLLDGGWWFVHPFDKYDVPGGRVIIENKAPVASITYSPKAPKSFEVVNFDASESIDSDDSIVHYSWDFADGNIAEGQNVSHFFEKPGEYWVKLMVKDELGLANTDSVRITVIKGEEKLPVATFVYFPNNPLENEEISFDASGSYDPDGTIVSYLWQFDDGKTGEGMEVKHSYANPDEYKVTLTITDNSGLQKTFSRVIDLFGKNPAIFGTIYDVQLENDGTIFKSYLKGARIDVYQDGSFLQTTHSSEYGDFRFDNVLEEQLHELRVLADGFAVESQDKIELKSKIKDIKPSDSEIETTIPLSLALQKMRLIYDLENLNTRISFYSPAIEALLFAGSYDEKKVKQLLAKWFENVQMDSELKIESLARLVLAEQILDSLFDDALTMSHEANSALYEIAKSFFAMIISFDHIYSTILINNSTQLPILKLYRKITKDQLSNLFVTVFSYYSRGLVTEEYKTAMEQTSRVVLSAATFLTFQTGDPFKEGADGGLKEIISAIGDQIRLSLYTENTQKYLDIVNTNAKEFDFSGNLSQANNSIRSVIKTTHESTENIRIYSDNLQLAGNLFDAISDGASYAYYFPGLLAFKSLIGALKGISLMNYATSYAIANKQLYEIEKTYVPKGTQLAFNTNSSSKNDSIREKLPTQMHTAKYNTLQQQKSLLQNSSLYLDGLQEIISSAEQGARTETIKKIPELFELDQRLSEALFISQAPIYSVADLAFDEVDDFDEKYIALGNAVGATITERMILNTQLVDYSLNSVFSIDSLIMQADSIREALKVAKELIKETVEFVSGLSASPLVMVTKHEVNTDVHHKVPFEIQTTIKNVGANIVDEIIVTLVSDSTTEILSQEKFKIATLAPDEEQVFTWKLQIDKPDQLVGSYFVELKSDNAKTLSANGIFFITNPSLTVGIADHQENSDSGYEFKQNFPNPVVNGKTVFEFTIPNSCWVQLNIIDGSGKIIKQLLDEHKNPGTYRVKWNPKYHVDGTYFVQIQACNFGDSKKIIFNR
ncbi:PKD domain-containing protein [Fulvivirgaceae bacterium BMA12]|uniref:PKD domain-containing protein n=1 Tax=Agaribacillus aureus TaxID=3051825 RepID=A0ABT8LAB8_9BACT|nr:PKD domain-containing protein [Fulvivirgaceae bacterium BMA12]